LDQNIFSLLKSLRIQMQLLTSHRIVTSIGACICLVLAACSTTVAEHDERVILASDIETTPPPAARNVILFIGDGMGVSTVTAMRILDGQEKGLSGEENVLSFERFPHVALSKTYETNQQVGESAGTGETTCARLSNSRNPSACQRES
jgi:alkaline phosphatase